jgi:hypothetical protein
MEPFDREDVKAVLARFAIRDGRRADPVDATEEIILLTPVDFSGTDINALTSALMDVLPHRKVWVVLDGPTWRSEAL